MNDIIDREKSKHPCLLCEVKNLHKIKIAINFEGLQSISCDLCLNCNIKLHKRIDAALSE